MVKRYVIELGWGVDLHGQDSTKAACRAVEDAISKSCLCGLVEILGIEDLNEVLIDVTIATPYWEQVDKERVLEVLPIGKKSITVKEGGMEVPGLLVDRFGDKKDSIIVANAYIVVSVK